MNDDIKREMENLFTLIAELAISHEIFLQIHAKSLIPSEAFDNNIVNRILKKCDDIMALGDFELKLKGGVYE